MEKSVRWLMGPLRLSGASRSRRMWRSRAVDRGDWTKQVSARATRGGHESDRHRPRASPVTPAKPKAFSIKAVPVPPRGSGVRRLRSKRRFLGKSSSLAGGEELPPKEFQGPVPGSRLLCWIFGKPNILKFFNSPADPATGDHGVRRPCQPRQQGYPLLSGGRLPLRHLGAVITPRCGQAEAIARSCCSAASSAT